MDPSTGRHVARHWQGAPRQLVELLPSNIGLPLRAWKNYPRLHGLYAPVRALHRLIPTGRNAVDAGANRGVYAYWIAQRARHVYAFEPLPGPSSYLERAKIPNITVLNVALSDTSGQGLLWVPDVEGEASLGPHVDADRAASVPVTLARLDDFHLTDVGFMKIDVEGHELEVLRGAEATIATSRPTVFIEVEQRYRRDSIDVVFEYLAGPLSYRYGYAWHRGRLLPLADFEVGRQQQATTGDRSGDYVNNFAFSDVPLG